MKKFNLIKSLTRVINNRKGLLILCLSLAVLGVNEVWGNTTYYATAYAKSNQNKSGAGKIYVSCKGNKPNSESDMTDCDQTDSSRGSAKGDKNATVTAHFYATVSTGYTFKGWYSDQSCVTLKGEGDKNDKYHYQEDISTSNKNDNDNTSITRYAKFTANTYTVTFDKGEGTGGSNNVTATFDSAMPSASAPSRLGYTFNGYYDATSGGTQYYNANMGSARIWDKASNTTLYAQYKVGYSNAIAKVSSTGGGQVYVTGDNIPYDNVSGWQDNQDAAKRQDVTHTYYFFAKPDKTHVFKGWSESDGGTIISGSKTDDKRWGKDLTITSTTSTETNPQNFTYYAVFGDANQFYASAYAQSVPNDNTMGWCYISCNDGVPNESWWTTNKKINDSSTGSVTTVDDEGQVHANFYARALHGYKFEDWYIDAACTTRATAGTRDFSDQNHYYEDITTSSTTKPGPSITRYAKFIPVKVSSADEQTINFTAQTDTKSATLTFPVENASSNDDFNTPTVDNGWSVSSWNYANNQVTVVVSFTATENTTTRGDHKATVTLTAKSGESATGDVTAHVAMAPILTDKVPTNKLVDDGAIDLNTLWTSSSNGEKNYTIKTWTTDGGAHNGGAVEPAINGSTLSLGDAGTLVLQLSQAEGTSSETKTAEHTLTINRRDNNIFINGNQDSYAANAFMDGYAQIDLTATNTDYAGSPITANQTAGTDIATFYQNDRVVYSTYKLGDATWTVSQPENYKYKAANASFTIHVIKEAEETCNVATSSSTYWAKLGNTTDALTWTDKNAAKDLYFKASISTASMWNTIQVQQCVNGEWNDIGSKIDENSYPNGSKPVVTLSQAATGVRWKIAGSLGSDVTNVRVTRATYLNAANVEITETSSHNPIHPGEKGVGTLTINHSLANGGDLKVKWDNAKFTIGGKTAADGINLGDKGCSTGVTELAIEYVSQEAGKDNATVVIYNNVYRATATITGTTNKQQQTITWKENIDILTAGTDVEDPASSTVGNVTYTTSDEKVISVEGNIIHALKAGTATITAFSAGNTYYADITEEKEITVTDDKVQYIVWNQSLTNLKLEGEDKTLTASAQSDVDGCTTNGARQITYTSSNDNIVKIINNNQLKIVGVGIATVTATQAGGEDADGHKYIPVSMQKKVVVRDPNAACVNYIYEQPSEWSCDLGWNLATTNTETHEIDFGGLEPGYFNLDYMGKSHDVAVHYYEGKMYVDEWVDNQWKTAKEIGEPSEDKYFNTGDIALSRKATKMRFRATGKAGYFYFKDCTVTLARYLETANTLNTFEAKVNAQHKQTLSIKYSNIEGPLTLKLTSGTSFSIDIEEIEGECGSKGTADIVITYFPKAANEEETDVLTITDGKSSTLVINLTGSASKTERHIVWEQDPTPVYTIETITFNAEGRTTLNEVVGEVYYTLAQNSTAKGTINGNTLSFSKFGTAYVAVNTKSDDRYTDAATITKSWTVSKTPTTITTNPTIGDVVSGTALDAIVLQGGEAQNTVNNQAVEGTFSVTDGDLVNVGEQTLTITFTPNNTDMYEGCTTTIVANVVQREATAEEVGTPSAAPITYGSVINTSALSGNGSLAGTWSWVDEDANKATPNVGTIDNLNVIFTPNDGNIKPATTTVSLTVTAATPTLTWTAKEETAQVHETKTFTASSTNTDNTAAITYSIISDGDNATIDASTGEVTMLKAGTITIQASQAATTNFAAPSSITTTCTISKAPTKITTNPEIDGDIVYGAQLDDLKLKANTGSARNTVNQQTVEGTFSITGGDLSAAGEKTITVTFTPANTDMYASCTSTVPVTVQKAEPDAIAQASEIIYGAKVESSQLTNTGTTAGTWTWTDETKEQVLEVGTHEGLNVHFTPTDQTNYNEIDGTVSLTVKKAAATLTWTTAPESADVKDKLTYTATSNHSESAIIYAITEGADCATIDASTGALTITKAGTITVQASQDATTHYEAAEITVTTTLTGEFENVFSGEGDWNDPKNWTYGVPTSDNPDVVISGNMTIGQSISVGSLTIEAGGSVTIVVEGDLTVNGTSKDRDTYGNLFVRNGGDVTISENANVKVFDFVVESSIGTEGQSISGQVKHSNRVLYTNGAYIDINMDSKGKMDDTQWYAFTVPFPVDVQSGIARKEGDTFRKCTYGVEYMICEYDINQRLNTGKGWKYIKSGQLQPGRFYYFTVNGDYNVYSFKAAENTITINNTTELRVNGEGPNANWNAVGNTTLTYATISGEKVPDYVQTYVNGESRYITVATDDAQFVVGCPFFFQASETATMILNEANKTIDAHYAPRQESVDKPVCVRIAEEDKHFSDQIYLTASQEATSEYTLGRDLAKAGIGTKSAQLWMNAYGQKLSVQDATLMGDQAYYELSIYAPKAGSYELSLPKIPSNAVIYLTQNGYPIWNLNETPYVIECYKGTTNEYGLLLRLQEGGSPTDMQTMRSREKVQKIMKNQRIYINANSQLYDLMGQKVK